MAKTVVESKFSKGKVNNEIEFCKVNDKNVKTAVERALLGERISYFIKWEKPMQEIIDKYDTTGTPYLLPIIKDVGKDERRQYKNASHLVNCKLKK